jgi:hypothetical protein
MPVRPPGKRLPLPSSCIKREVGAELDKRYEAHGEPAMTEQQNPTRYEACECSFCQPDWLPHC